jgi:hypothetical protein
MVSVFVMRAVERGFKSWLGQCKDYTIGICCFSAKDWEVLTTSGTYPWSFVTQIFHNGQPSHGGDRKSGDFELEIKDTTDTDRSASCLDLHLEIDSVGRLRVALYDKRDDFNVPIVNFQFICSNIPADIIYISEREIKGSG